MMLIICSKYALPILSTINLNNCCSYWVLLLLVQFSSDSEVFPVCYRIAVGKKLRPSSVCCLFAPITSRLQPLRTGRSVPQVHLPYQSDFWEHRWPALVWETACQWSSQCLNSVEIVPYWTLLRNAISCRSLLRHFYNWFSSFIKRSNLKPIQQPLKIASKHWGWVAGLERDF